MKRENEVTVDILRHARHFLVKGRYADSARPRRVKFLCYAITNVETFMELEYDKTDYARAREVVCSRLGGCKTLWTHLSGGNAHGLTPEDWIYQTSVWCTIRDEWLDALIRELEEE